MTMAKPDAQTVAQMAATIAAGLIADPENDNNYEIVSLAVELARAIVEEVERTETEQEVNSTRSDR
jgi:hypothetical protein